MGDTKNNLNYIIPAAVIVVIAYLLHPTLSDFRLLLMVAFSVILTAVIPLVCYIGGSAAERCHDRLVAIEDKAIGRTAYAVIAKQYFKGMSGRHLLSSSRYPIPITFFTVLVFLFSLGAFLGADSEELLSNWNFFLSPHQNSEDVDKLKDYQIGTMITISMAALGAYFIVSLRLIRRINNFDVQPILFYFLSYHVLLAVIVAGIVRHFLAISVDDDPRILAVMGFGIGLQPDIFLAFVAKIARDKISAASSRQSPPAVDFQPTNLSLVMIEGLTIDKRGRLEEMGIDNCQSLAEYNPYVIWVRTAFQLQQIIDWIAQAQLYVIVKEDGLKRLRPYVIRDVFGFVIAGDGNAKTELANLLNIPVEILEANINNLKLDSSYTRLLQVRDELRN
ncbi:MAG: hypothetical protein ACI808_002265 [Paraglaciecola sp.]|jgi:hypothetical protein